MTTYMIEGLSIQLVVRALDIIDNIARKNQSSLNDIIIKLIIRNTILGSFFLRKVYLNTTE